MKKLKDLSLSLSLTIAGMILLLYGVDNEYYIVRAICGFIALISLLIINIKIRNLLK